MLSLALSPEVDSFRDSMVRFCERALGTDVQARRATSFSRALWLEVAALGLFEIAGTDIDGAMLFACIGTEVLGYHGFPGPVPQTIAASGAGMSGWAAQADGNRIVTFGGPPVIAWAGVADDIICIDGKSLSSGIAGEPVDTLGRTDAAEVRAGVPIGGDAADVIVPYDMAVAAYVGGAGRFLIDIGAEHAQTRKQFGRSLGEFQAVAFPLAEALMLLDGAQVLTRAAAMAIDAKRDDAGSLAAAARVSATRAALKASFAAHQTFGAHGVLDDGPVGWLSRRIQEYATLAPSVRLARATVSLDVAARLDPELWPMPESA